MFRKSKWKYMALILGSLVILWVGTLGVIYFTTYRSYLTESREMLELYASSYAENGKPSADMPVSGDGETDGSTLHRYSVSTFYSVCFHEDQTEIVNDDPSPFTDQQLENFAQALSEKSSEYGITKDMIYLVSEGSDYTLVTIMDISTEGEILSSLMHYTLIYGGLAVVILFAIAMWLAGRFMRPIEEAYRKQREFISDAGHELKTPVAAIRANAEVLGQEIGDNKWLDNINYENKQMEDIVTELLDLARLENGKSDMEEVDLSHSLMSVVLPLEAIAFENGIRLCYEQVEEGISCQGDRKQLEKLMAALIENAVDHAPADTEVRLELGQDRGRITLTVANQGQPISEEDREKIFQRFSRLDSARSGGSQHYGLGLAIARSIAEAHGGDIRVECPEGWVEFIVRIPTPS